MEELAQSVGNAKMPGEVDWDVATAVDPNKNGARPFQRLAESNPHLGREEALSLLTQRIAQLPTGPKKVYHHEQLGCVTGSRICQIHAQTVALLRNYLWRVSEPVRSGAERSRALPPPALQTPKHSVALPGTSDVIRRFNRDTARLATLVMGVVVFAALVLAALVRDRHPKAADLTDEASQAGGDLWLDADRLGTPFEVVGLNGKRFTGETPASNPEISPTTAQANASSWSPAHRQYSTRVIPPRTFNVRFRSYLRLRAADIKMRLIALWHRSLLRSNRSRTSKMF
jgi:hypothetical protein